MVATGEGWPHPKASAFPLLLRRAFSHPCTPGTHRELAAERQQRCAEQETHGAEVGTLHQAVVAMQESFERVLASIQLLEAERYLASWGYSGRGQLHFQTAPRPSFHRQCYACVALRGCVPETRSPQYVG